MGFKPANTTHFQNQWSQPGYKPINNTYQPNQWPQSGYRPNNNSYGQNQWQQPGYPPLNTPYGQNQLNQPGYRPINNSYANNQWNQSAYNTHNNTRGYRSPPAYKPQQQQWNLYNQTRGQNVSNYPGYYQPSAPAAYPTARPMQPNVWPSSNNNGNGYPHGPTAYGQPKNNSYYQPPTPAGQSGNSHLYPSLPNSGYTRPQTPTNSVMPNNGQSHLYPQLPNSYGSPQLPVQPQIPTQTQKPILPNDGNSGIPLAPLQPQGPQNWHSNGPAALSYPSGGYQPGYPSRNSNNNPYASMVN